MPFTLNIIQSWEEIRKYIPYESKVDDIKDCFPIRFYKNKGEDVTPIFKELDKLTVILTSNSNPEKKQLEDLFDTKCMSNLDDGLYLVDYILSKVLIDAQTGNILEDDLFSYLPPNSNSNKIDATNFLFIDRHLGWHRCYGGNSSLPHLFHILDEINYTVWEKDNFTPLYFGTSLLTDAIVDLENLKSPVQFEKESLIKSIKPRGLDKPFLFGKLLARYGTLEEQDEDDEYWDDAWGEGRLPPYKRPAIKKSKEVVLADGSIMESKSNYLTLTQLLRFHVPPTVKEDVYVDIDIPLSGITQVVVRKDKLIQVHYNSSLRTDEEVFDVFSNINPSFLILHDTSSKLNYSM
jgi:hypothetical protein